MEIQFSVYQNHEYSENGNDRGINFHPQTLIVIKATNHANKILSVFTF
jgi:hypothetical protein